ncbi:MAG TPA: hypothetical protein VKY40_01205 [Halanaerobiales bacterium]|nr:hypothetical protein [Halanaerobiales bacterium]
MDSTLKEILDEPLAVQIFKEHAPEMMDNPMIEQAYSSTLSELMV